VHSFSACISAFCRCCLCLSLTLMPLVPLSGGILPGDAEHSALVGLPGLLGTILHSHSLPSTRYLDGGWPDGGGRWRNSIDASGSTWRCRRYLSAFWCISAYKHYLYCDTSIHSEVIWLPAFHTVTFIYHLPCHSHSGCFVVLLLLMWKYDDTILFDELSSFCYHCWV